MNPRNSGMVVYLLFSTSNHNIHRVANSRPRVVYLLFSTSNHNVIVYICEVMTLYIFSFLHQTTTPRPLRRVGIRCISSLFYIKPQPFPCDTQHLIVVYLLFSTSNHNLDDDTPLYQRVVYLLFSTSNHNSLHSASVKLLLYIFSFLHQTTTIEIVMPQSQELYIFSFLHQTTT